VLVALGNAVSVRCFHPVLAELVDLGWHRILVAVSNAFYFRWFHLI
jgi:hypothetical protein